MRKHKVFIFGGGGKLGSVLAKKFFDAPYSNTFDLKVFKRRDIDVTRSQEVKDLILQQKPRIVINAIAFNAVDKCEEASFLNEALHVNADVPGTMAQACAEVGGILIHYSSDYVFAGDNPLGYEEDDLIKPINAYGWSKWLGEKRILDSGAKAYIIRTSRLFGPPGTSEHGKEGVIEQLHRISASSSKMEVVDGETANPTYSLDLAQATKELCEKEYPFGIYHVTNSEPCSRFNFYRLIVKELHLPLIVLPVSPNAVVRAAVRPSFSILQNTKFPVLRDWKLALQDLVQTFYNPIS